MFIMSLSIAEDSMDLSIWKNFNATTGQVLIATGNLFKAVRNGIVGHKASLMGFKLEQMPCQSIL